MNDGGDQARPGGRGLLAEAALVLVAGLAFALVANQLSPRGLSLTRDYFGRGTKPRSPRAAVPVSVGHGTTTDGLDPAVVARLKEKGLQAIGLKQASQLFAESQRVTDQVIFVDARDDANYQAGHVPGAYQLDYYHPENNLLTVVQACQRAGTVVVYCQGGDCEDSELAADLLRQAGVPADRLRVYPGGFTEWTNHALPVVAGGREPADPPGSKP